MKKILIAIGLFFALSFSLKVEATPVVSNVTGDISDAQTVTVTGSGFGTRADNDGSSAYMCLKWQNFDSASTAYDGFTYVDSTTNGVKSCNLSTSNQRTGSTKHVERNSTDEVGGMGFNSSSTNNGYFNFFWRKVQSGTTFTNILAQEKLVKIFNKPPANSDNYPTFTASKLEDSGRNHQMVFGEGTVSDTDWLGNGTFWDDNQWHPVITFVREQTAAGAANARAYFRVGSVSLRQFLAKTFTMESSGRYTIGGWWTVGHFQRYFTKPVFYDDVYFDYTLAQGYIGNSSSFASCTQLEIQIPKSWADGISTFEVNQGGFANGATAYFFIVDENGVPSSGKQIQFGTSSSPSDQLPPSLNSTSPTQGMLLSADLTFRGTDATGPIVVTAATFDGHNVVGALSSSGSGTDKTYTLANASFGFSPSYDQAANLIVTWNDSQGNSDQFTQPFMFESTPPTPITSQFSTGTYGNIDNYTKSNSNNWEVVVDTSNSANTHASTKGTFSGAPGAGMVITDLTLSGSSVYLFSGKVTSKTGPRGDYYIIWGDNNADPSSPVGSRACNFIRLDDSTGNSFYGYFDTDGSRTTVGYFDSNITGIPSLDTWYQLRLELDGTTTNDTWRLYRGGTQLTTQSPVTNFVDASGLVGVGTSDDLIGYDGADITTTPEQPPMVEPPLTGGKAATITRVAGSNKTAIFSRSGQNKKMIMRRGTGG